MKFKERQMLIGITALFLVFTLGFFLGRNLVRPAVLTARVTPAVETMPASLPTEPSVPGTTGIPEPAFPLNINTASAEELTFLPGIGEVMARRIVDWRDANGPYEALTDLLEVEGIGEHRLEQILPYITTGG